MWSQHDWCEKPIPTWFSDLGPVGAINRTAVPPKELDQWRTEGTIDYLGASDCAGCDRQQDCVVLPSYREGLPPIPRRRLAMGKPLIGTAVPGCRDVIVDGQTGFLFMVRSAHRWRRC